MLQVMETDSAKQFVVRPNRLCGGWDFYRLCGLFKTELSARKDVVIKAWFQLPSVETMSVLPKGKYYYDLSDVSTDGIVASTGTRYCLCEKVDEESEAELIEWKPRARPPTSHVPSCSCALCPTAVLRWRNLPCGRK